MLNEAETRAKLIDPALHARGWTEDLIKREETAGAVKFLRANRAAVRKAAWIITVPLAFGFLRKVCNFIGDGT
jgi:type I restriction enzyme R subunit